MLLAITALLPVLCATPDVSATEAPARAPLAHVAFVGASVTAGFGTHVEYELENGGGTTSFDLASVLEAGLSGEGSTFRSFGDAMFFGKPMVRGPALLKRALAEQPTMVVGLDFLFWFAYGGTDHEGKPIDSREQRFMKLEEGLKLLESVECTLVLGDLADMSSAVGTMLLPQYVPDPDTLAICNGRIYEWADEHENVIMIPLAETVARIQADKELKIGDHVWPAGSRATLIHKDKLHSTIEGTIALAQLIALRLEQAGVVEKATFDLAADKVLPRLQERAVETGRQQETLMRAREAAKETVPG